MRQAIRDWLAETHGTRFELLRHFLPRFFDSNLVASSNDWTRVGTGALAMLASSWIILFATLLFKYKKLAEMNLTDRFPQEVAADLTSLTCAVVCLAILLVASLWQSVYPALRDCLALAARPVSFADIFVAKFSAVAIVFSVFVLLLAVPTAVVYASVTGANVASSFLNMVAACSAAFFAPIALQGALLNLLPARVFDRVMIWIQALLAAVSIGGFPLAVGKGHAIVGDLHFSMSDLLLGAFVPPVVATLIYLVSFHRYRRLFFEAALIRAPQRRDFLSWFLDLFVPDPREQAAFAFIWKTIERSRIHRLAVLVYAGLAAAWIGKSAIDLASTSAPEGDLNRMLVRAGPLTLILFTLLGLRHLFSLPADLSANWIFRVAERAGRRAWLNAVERFVLVCGIAPVVLAGAIFSAWSDGPFVAVAWAAIAFFLAAFGFEYLFRDWRKLPFTCSYLPGKRPLIITCALFVGLTPLLAPVAFVFYRGATNPASFLVILGVELAVWSYLRRSRMARWGLVPLRYEEQVEAEIDTFDLSGDGTVLAQEHFQREWDHYLRGDPDVPVIRELEAGETRTGRLWEWLTAIPQDLRYAARMLTRNLSFTLTAVLTLGLGLGLNAAFFTIFNAFLLKPLAVRDPGSLVSVDFETRYRTPIYLGWRDYESLAANTQALSETAASTLEGTGLDGQSAKAALVSGNFFSMLGAGVALGRPFQSGEQDAVLVLSYRAWKNRFGSDENILGRRLLVNGFPIKVIAVAAPEFAGVAVGTVAIGPVGFARFGLGAADFWMPIDVWNRLPGFTQVPVRGVIGRLRSGTSSQQAETILTASARQITADRVDYDRIARASLDSLDIAITWTALTYSVPLLLAFGLTMLIPCANAANLMLARSMARQRELGVRLSLGAGRGRLVRQLLTESLILAILAAAAGLALAHVTLGLFTQLIYTTAPPSILFKFRLPDFSIDAHVFFYMLIVAGPTTVLFALAPALQATRIAFALRGEFGAFRASRLRDALVVGQVSACVMLLMAAGILLRGSRRITTIDRGYEARGIYGIANQSPEDARPLLSALNRETWIDTLAFLGGPLNEMDSIDVGDPARPGWRKVYYNHASGEFFRLARIPLLRGRTFTREEGENHAPVVVVGALVAKQLWPGEDPIGKTISIQTGQPGGSSPLSVREAIVIGVSRDIVSRARDGGPRPVVHFPDMLRRGTVVAVRGRGAPEQTRRSLEAVLARAPGAEHGARVVALHETIDWETYPQQAASWLSSLLGLVALLLAISGMYGVMSYLVSQRTKEIGIRMAVGATKGQVARFFLNYSARLAGAGLLFGALLALGVLQYTASKIDLVIDFYDIPAYLLSLAIVAVSALCATLGPTRRACGIDPQGALRSD